MAGRQPEPPRGPFVCEFCAEVWPSARALAGHIKAHSKGRAPQVPFPSVPLPPAIVPGPCMVPVMPPFFLAPPPVLALGQPVAPAAGCFFGGLPRQPLLEPRVQVRQPQAAPPLMRDPVVSGAGGRITMVLLDPNPAFWAPYRMGMGMDPPVELDFMGLRQQRRPESPSPTFAGWINA
jgi:hypothetical protein